MIAYWTVTVPYSDTTGAPHTRDQAIIKARQELQAGLASKGISVTLEDVANNALVTDSWNTSGGDGRADASEAHVHLSWPANF